MLSRGVPRLACSSLSHGLRRLHSLSEAPIDVSPEVQDALHHGSAVVALESAIITDGMPQPINLNTALSVEGKVRSAGSIPATIGLLDGRFKVGLTRAQLERLADVNHNSELMKLSRRDLPAAVGLRMSGGTTISATSILANLVGIRVFATGGLGGVHRGGEISWDVSADLTELGRTPIAVVSAGVKSILDIGRTLEYLETQGVTVITYGATNEFPGFYGPVSGHKSPWRVEAPEVAADIISAGQRLGLKSGILFAAPIPEEYGGAAAAIQDAVDQAIRESEENGMNKRGKGVTPWLLRRVAELTQGNSIPSNVALIENTATIGSKIAVQYANLLRRTKEQPLDASHFSDRLPPWQTASDKEDIVADSAVASTLPPASLLVVGAAAVDVTSKPKQTSIIGTSGSAHSTSPGQVSLSLGGVARNMAEAAHRILSTSLECRPHSVVLVSPLGDDIFARLISDGARHAGMRTDGFLPASDQSQRSAVCSLHLDTDGNLMTGVADMSIVNTLGAAPIIGLIEKHLPSIVAFDANLSSDTLASLLRFCALHQIPSFFEPTSVANSASILPALHELIDNPHVLSAPVKFASPNLLELAHIFHEARSSRHELFSKQRWWSVIDGLCLGNQYRSDLALLSQQPISSTDHERLSFLTDGTAQMAVSLLPFIQNLFVTCGHKGVFVAMRVIDEEALRGGWGLERTLPDQHQVIAKGKDDLLVLKHYPAIPIEDTDVVNVTGAGDSFVGALLAAECQGGGLGTPQALDKVVERAQRASVLSLCSPEAVSPLLSENAIDKLR